MSLGSNVGPATALWITGQCRSELRTAPEPTLNTGEVLVRTLFSAISRGTERLVFEGRVPASEHERMTCPMQDGTFPFPVKYGYCAVGEVVTGPDDLIGRTIFALHPHQDVFTAPAAMVTPVPAHIPPKRATLAANMETALNALWDAGAGPADRIVVIGAGLIGCLVAHLAARLPGARVTLVDIDETRRDLAAKLGLDFALPAQLSDEADIAFHTSAAPSGLDTAIASVGLEGKVVEMSWYGDAPTPVKLGGTFHSRRISLLSSQVGQVSPSRRARWTYADRIAAAIALLNDPRLDALVEDEISFQELPARLGDILAPGASGLAPVVRYR